MKAPKERVAGLGQTANGSTACQGNPAPDLEPCRALPGHTKCSLECKPNLPDQTLVEQPAKDRDSVRHATSGSELRQRIRRVWGSVTSRLRDLDEPGAERERWMAGEVRDGELLVAQRRHDQHVDFLEDARHFQRHLAP